MKKLTLGVLFTMLTASSSALAQMEERAERAPRVNVEVAPLSLLLNAAPGVNSAGLAGEMKMTDRTTLRAEGMWLNANLDQDLQGRMDADIKPDTLRGYSASLGMLAYRDPDESSWYGGGKVGYMESSGTWDYRGSSIDQDTTAIIPAVMGGYRWLYGNNVTLRLGASAGANLVQTNDIAANDVGPNAAAGEDELEDAVTQPVTGTLDFLIGYAF